MKPGLLKYPGGKSYLAERIASRVGRSWKCYVEPFLGGGAVLLQVRGTGERVGADVYEGLIDLWQHVRAHDPEFVAGVRRLRYDEETFLHWGRCEALTPLDRAIKCLVTHRFSRGGTGRAFAWSERLRGGKPGDVNAWENFVARLEGISKCVRGVEFLCESAFTLIPRLDSLSTVFYLDPPYVHETRVSTSLYAHEMSYADHERLITLLRTVRGRVLLSGYAHPLYDSLGWHRTVWDMPCNQGQTKTKSRRKEVLWENR